MERCFECLACGVENKYTVQYCSGVPTIASNIDIGEEIVFIGSNQGEANLKCEKCKNKTRVRVNLMK